MLIKVIIQLVIKNKIIFFSWASGNVTKYLRIVNDNVILKLKWTCSSRYFYSGSASIKSL